MSTGIIAVIVVAVIVVGIVVFGVMAELRTAVQHYRVFGGRLADFTGES